MPLLLNIGIDCSLVTYFYTFWAESPKLDIVPDPNGKEWERMILNHLQVDNLSLPGLIAMPGKWISTSYDNNGDVTINITITIMLIGYGSGHSGAALNTSYTWKIEVYRPNIWV